MVAREKSPLLGEADLRKIARNEVLKLVNANLESKEKIKVGDVYVVWECWILGNWKALLSTTVENGCYYEFTYDKMQKRAYLDEYEKRQQKKIDCRIKIAGK